MRHDILKRKSEIEEWIAENRSKAFICRELNCKPDTLNSHLTRMGLQYSGNRGGKGWKQSSRTPVTDYLVYGSLIKTHALRLKLIRDGVKEHRCERCLRREWFDDPIPLELHHKDGDGRNNRLENLELLCPNCHALTPNHAGKGKRTLVSQLAEECALEA